jgi:Arc/MetJ-type ribon-helix-helix transcriptional regulator
VSRVTIAVTVDSKIIADIDRLVTTGVFPNRSKAFEIAIGERLRQMRRSRLALESAKLDPTEEQALANEGYAELRAVCGRSAGVSPAGPAASSLPNGRLAPASVTSEC